MTARLADVLYRWRFVSLSVALGGLLAFVPTMRVVSIDHDVSAWLSRDDPAYRDYDRLTHEFGGTRSLIVALEGEAIFTPDGLAYLQRITRDLGTVSLVTRVHSLANASIIRRLSVVGEEDEGIAVTPLIPDRDLAPAAARDVRREALDDPLLRGDLVSEDAQVTAVLVTFDEDRIDAVRTQVLEDIRRVIERDQPTGITAYYNGSLQISEAYDQALNDNIIRLTPPVVVLTLVGIYWLFRSVRKTLLLALAAGASVVWTLGLYALTGNTFNILTSMLPPLVLVLAIADDVHIVQHFDHALRVTGSKEEAFKSSIRHLFVPLLGASGTTALGLLSLTISDVAAVRAFGVGSAIGVMTDFALSIAVVPALLTLVRADAAVPPQERWFVAPLLRAARLAYSHPVAVLALACCASVAAAAGAGRLRVDTNHINFFASTHPLSQSASLIDRKLSGINSFNVLLEGPAESIADPDTLARIERLSGELRTLPYVRKVTSVADYVKRANQQLAGGDKHAYRLPATREAVTQELFVFGLSDQGRDVLSRVVASDYSRAQIDVKLGSMSSDLAFEQINRAEQLAADAFRGSPVRPTVTGSGRLFATLDHYIVVSQLSSFITAFVTVFVVIFVVFRSLRFGVLGMVANTFPVLVVLGGMGWVGISLNVATVMVASVALGIVDDDTIHFINRYRHEVAAGAGTLGAIELAAIHEGRAALTTTIINSLSFSVLMASAYRPTGWFGALLAVTLMLAFITELFLVPAIIAVLPRIFGAPAVAKRVNVAL